MKRSLYSYSALFLAGGVLYPLLELLWRGYSHPSMILLGGIGLGAIRWVDRRTGPCGFLWKALLSTVIITELELLFGLILNVKLKLAVWDYSSLPLNLAGQICPLYSFFWFLLSLAAIFLFRTQAVRRFIFLQKPKKTLQKQKGQA